LYAYGRYEFFYQIGLSEFGNFGKIELEEGLVIKDLLALAMRADESDPMTEQELEEEMEVFPLESSLIQTTVDILVQRRDMISEYFALNITPEGTLTSLPLLLKNYTPYYGKLPIFLRCLGRNVCVFDLKLNAGRLVHGETLLQVTSERNCFVLYARAITTEGNDGGK
jgi:DNA mismatch repair protein MLH1